MGCKSLIRWIWRAEFHIKEKCCAITSKICVNDEAISAFLKLFVSMVKSILEVGDFAERRLVISLLFGRRC